MIIPLTFEPFNCGTQKKIKFLLTKYHTSLLKGAKNPSHRLGMLILSDDNDSYTNYDEISKMLFISSN